MVEPGHIVVTAKPANVGIKVDSDVVITEVTTGSQGEKLGLCTGMRVLSIDGTAVTSSAAVTRGVSRGDPGSGCAARSSPPPQPPAHS